MTAVKWRAANIHSAAQPVNLSPADLPLRVRGSWIPLYLHGPAAFIDLQCRPWPGGHAGAPEPAFHRTYSLQSTEDCRPHQEVGGGYRRPAGGRRKLALEWQFQPPDFPERTLRS